MPPWSRIRPTQPFRVTCSPAAAAFSSPQVTVRFISCMRKSTPTLAPLSGPASSHVVRLIGRDRLEQTTTTTTTTTSATTASISLRSGS